MIITAPGKIILFGEHAVVYDKLGIVTAVNLRAKITAEEAGETTLTYADGTFKINREDMAQVKQKVDRLIEEKKYSELKRLATDSLFSLKNVLSHSINEKDYCIKIESEIPMASGLGSGSAVFACLAAIYKNNLEEIRQVSYLGDVVAHGGTPSGIDNSAVVYGRYLLFRKSEGIKRLDIGLEPSIVIGHTGIRGSTAVTVSHVRENIERFMPHIDEIEKVAQRGLIALQDNDLGLVGKLMNENQTLLEKIEVSHPKLEELIEIARKNGALGAKLSGGGGGGVMIALCKDKDSEAKVKKAIEDNGCKAYIANLGAEGLRVVR